jgi:hypothetical protein
VHQSEDPSRSRARNGLAPRATQLEVRNRLVVYCRYFLSFVSSSDGRAHQAWATAPCHTFNTFQYNRTFVGTIDAKHCSCGNQQENDPPVHQVTRNRMDASLRLILQTAPRFASTMLVTPLPTIKVVRSTDGKAAWIQIVIVKRVRPELIFVVPAQHNGSRQTIVQSSGRVVEP